MSSNAYIGSSLDDLLEEDGALVEINAIALKRVLSRLNRRWSKRNKTKMANEMKTSRASLARLLDQNTSVTLSTMGVLPGSWQAVAS